MHGLVHIAAFWSQDSSSRHEYCVFGLFLRVFSGQNSIRIGSGMVQLDRLRTLSKKEPAGTMSGRIYGKENGGKEYARQDRPRNTRNTRKRTTTFRVISLPSVRDAHDIRCCLLIEKFFSARRNSCSFAARRPGIPKSLWRTGLRRRSRLAGPNRRPAAQTTFHAISRCDERS
jgi:hypothetical protein